jgi:hypothetical protein
MATTKSPDAGLIAAQKKWFNNYSNQIKQGTANLNDMNRYNGYAKYLKLNKATLTNNTVHDLSIKALSGDSRAQQYLKAMNLQSQTAKTGLWKGVNEDYINKNAKLKSQYINDNPMSNLAKTNDYSIYQTYNDAIMNDKPLSDQQLQWYNQNLNKWNLEDFNDPYTQNREQLKKDKTSALTAQDKALNQGLTASDANNFQSMQQLQQQMSDKGMGASGIAADAYMRATMANNQSYQQQFADSATKKSDINAQYNDAIAQSKIDQIKHNEDVSAQEAELQTNAAKAQADLANAQTTQDKYLTASTGYVYLNGKMLTGASGQPMTSMEFQKLSETQRHNLTTEGLTAQKYSQDYSLGAEKNDIARMKIQADITKASQNLQLAYDKLDKDYYVANANIDKATAQLDISARNAATAEQRNAISAISSKIKAVQSQIKKGKPTAAQKKTLKGLMAQMDGVLGGK